MASENLFFRVCANGGPSRRSGACSGKLSEFCAVIRASEYCAEMHQVRVLCRMPHVCTLSATSRLRSED